MIAAALVKSLALEFDQQVVLSVLNNLVGSSAVNRRFIAPALTLGDHSQNPIPFRAVWVNFEQFRDCLPRRNEIFLGPETCGLTSQSSLTSPMVK